MASKTAFSDPQEVMVGEGYQAKVPEYAPSTPYPSTAATSGDCLVWSPRGSTEEAGELRIGIA